MSGRRSRAWFASLLAVAAGAAGCGDSAQQPASAIITDQPWVLAEVLAERRSQQ